MATETLAQRLRHHVEMLASQPRPASSRAHRDARAYIDERFRHAGFDVEEARFRVPGAEAINLMTAALPGDPKLPLLIMGAHYDSIPDSPGADDNASAVAALLELATALRPRLYQGSQRARLQLVAYDLEELGMLASAAHAALLREQNTSLRGMISLEMLGYTSQEPGSQGLPSTLVGLYPDVGNFIGIVGNERSTELVDTITGQMKTILHLPVESMIVPANGHPLPETRLSDHSAFWDLGFPAVMITDTAFYRNPHYHQTTDTPDTLDYDFLERVTKGVEAAIVQLLGTASVEA